MEDAIAVALWTFKFILFAMFAYVFACWLTGGK